MKKNKKIKNDKILLFISQFNSLTKSGISFIQSLDILILSETDKNFIQILKKIRSNLNNGKDIYSSFKNFENIFGSYFIYMLKIGELSGLFNKALESSYTYLEYKFNNRQKIISLLIYPIIVLCISLLLLSFLLLFILPNFITIFEDNNLSLPSSTKFLIYVSNNFLYIMIFFVFLVIAFLFLKKYINSQPNLKLKKDIFLLNFFIFGKFYRLFYAIEIYYSLHIFIEGGISIIDGVKIMEENIENLCIKRNLEKVKRDINLGLSVSLALKNLDLFDKRFQTFIKAGEESGFLADTFLEMSKILKMEYEFMQKKFIALIEPISILFLGGLIAFILLAMYSPMLSITDTI